VKEEVKAEVNVSGEAACGMACQPANWCGGWLRWALYTIALKELEVEDAALIPD
jgi:hypothetical protein